MPFHIFAASPARKLCKSVSQLLGFTALNIVFWPAAAAAVLDRPFFRADAVVIVFGADALENTTGQPVAHDFYLLDKVQSGQPGVDLIASNGFVIGNSGQSDALGQPFSVIDASFGGAFNDEGDADGYLDPGDSYASFGVNPSTRISLAAQTGSTRFFVASNAAFDIYGQATDLVATGDFSSLTYSDLAYDFGYEQVGAAASFSWGGKAQDPAIGGDGIVIGRSDMGSTVAEIASGPTKVFDGGQKTAAQRGSIIEQAVSFTSSYSLAPNGGEYDFSRGQGSISAEISYTVYAP